jgi:hypothetical protein
VEGSDRDAGIRWARAGDAGGMPLPAASFLWKDLKERVDLHSLEDPVDRVGVLSGENDFGPVRIPSRAPGAADPNIRC